MKRPTGSGQIGGGWALLIAGTALFLLSFDVKVASFGGGVDPDAMMKRWAMLILGGSAVGIAFLLFATGWILRAIYFLPGREVDDADDAPSAPDPEDAKKQATTIVLVIAIMAVIGLIALAMNGA